MKTRYVLVNGNTSKWGICRLKWSDVKWYACRIFIGRAFIEIGTKLPGLYRANYIYH